MVMRAKKMRMRFDKNSRFNSLKEYLSPNFLLHAMTYRYVHSFISFLKRVSRILNQHIIKLEIKTCRLFGFNFLTLCLNTFDEKRICERLFPQIVLVQLLKNRFHEIVLHFQINYSYQLNLKAMYTCKY